MKIIKKVIIKIIVIKRASYRLEALDALEETTAVLGGAQGGLELLAIHLKVVW